MSTTTKAPKADKTEAAAAVTPEAKPEAKRKILTPAERVAKLEADLAEARKKAEAKENKAKTEATEKRAKLVEKRDALNVQIAELTKVIGDEPATEGSEG